MTELECSMPSVEVRMAIWGKEIDRLDVDEVVEILASRLRRETANPLALGWINFDHPNHVGENGQEWLLLAEGMPNAWRGQLLTAKAWPRVTAADLLPKVLRQAEKCGSRVAFLGGTAEGHQRFAARLASEYPSLALAGMWPSTPHMSATQSASLADEIRSARTDVLVVSLGKDRQQQWVDCYGSATGARLLLPFGVAVDSLTGIKRRALRSSQRTNRDVLLPADARAAPVGRPLPHSRSSRARPRNLRTTLPFRRGSLRGHVNSKDDRRAGRPSTSVDREAVTSNHCWTTKAAADVIAQYHGARGW